MAHSSDASISFFSKKTETCPVCAETFHRENLFMGRGRINVGGLTDELRRLYLPTAKYGYVNPLLYPITVCPACLFAAEEKDFEAIAQSPKIISQLQQYEEVRRVYLHAIFGMTPDFREARTLLTGIASYVLAVSSYSFVTKQFMPVAKRGIFCLRLGWLFSDLYRETAVPEHHELSELFYRRASDFYSDSLHQQATGEETIDPAIQLGPDTDKDYGLGGFNYLCAYLTVKSLHYIPVQELQAKKIQEARLLLSHVFGSGKKTKSHPEVLLDKVRALYDQVRKMDISVDVDVEDEEVEFD